MLLVPLTVAANRCVVPACNEADVGLIKTEMVGAAETVITAVADWLGSATLVAVTLKVPVDAGAV